MREESESETETECEGEEEGEGASAYSSVEGAVVSVGIAEGVTVHVSEGGVMKGEGKITSGASAQGAVSEADALAEKFRVVVSVTEDSNETPDKKTEKSR